MSQRTNDLERQVTAGQGRPVRRRPWHALIGRRFRATQSPIRHWLTRDHVIELPIWQSRRPAELHYTKLNLNLIAYI